MSEVDYMAHRQKMLHTLDLEPRRKAASFETLIVTSVCGRQTMAKNQCFWKLKKYRNFSRHDEGDVLNCDDHFLVTNW